MVAVIDGKEVTLCFDPYADGSVMRRYAREFVTTLGLLGNVDAMVESLVEKMFRQTRLRWNPSILHRDHQYELRPAVEVEFHDQTLRIDRGEAPNDAARRHCLEISTDIEKCVKHVADEVRMKRGFRFSFDRHYETARIDLETSTVAKASEVCNSTNEACAVATGEPLLVESGSFFYPFKLVALKALLDAVLDSVVDRDVVVCEVGFNFGHSSLLWLLASPRSRVRAFDIATNWYVLPAAEYLMARFPHRIDLTVGDSRTTLQRPPSDCDLIFIDGGHDYDTALSDIMAFRRNNQAILILDDINQDPVNHAWQTAIDNGIVEPEGDVYEQALFYHPTRARSALVYGTYNPLAMDQTEDPVVNTL